MALEVCRQYHSDHNGHSAHGDQHGVKQGNVILTDADGKYDPKVAQLRVTRADRERERERKATERSVHRIKGVRALKDVMATPSSLGDPNDQVESRCHSNLPGMRAVFID